MRLLRGIPIQRQLRVVILMTCSAALAVACGALFAFQYVFFRRDFERDLTATAEIIASNSTDALTVRDDDAARETLAALRAKPHITGAAIVLEDGTTLAQMGDAILPTGRVELPAAGLHRIGDETIFVWPIELDGNRLGTLLLHPDYRAQAKELLRLYAGILGAVLVLSFLVAALISWRLEDVLLEPIRHLAEVTRRIAQRNDYSVRAETSVEDEIGTFIASFNAMLDRIEEHDRALRHEIAERSRAEEALQRAHAQLMATSRQAGMAEVATGVLHNVGNVLNSVNVSATLIAEKLEHSRVGNLIKATALLREQGGGLADFLAGDARGRVLPGYLADVGLHLAAERTEARAEVERLARNIEHIKEIVAMQQSYARPVGFVEELALEPIIEEALRMNLGRAGQPRLAVAREYEPAPPVQADKHKVLQILVNLIGNAARAMNEVAPRQRQLTVSLRRSGAECAAVRVSDNGVGIPPENLTKIFSHGFTTRLDGHGFGLHSAALAAQQMGGRLTAESAGAGCGAAFILELPLAPDCFEPNGAIPLE